MDMFKTDTEALQALWSAMDQMALDNPPCRAVTMRHFARMHGLTDQGGRQLFYTLRSRHLIGINRLGNTIKLPYDFGDDTIRITEEGMRRLVGESAPQRLDATSAPSVQSSKPRGPLPGDRALNWLAQRRASKSGALGGTVHAATVHCSNGEDIED